MEQDSGIEEVAGEGGRRISRRTLIKGSAVVGATVWAAPVVESFTSRAFAASAAYYCCACGDPQGTGVPSDEFNQQESGSVPSSAEDCAAYCASFATSTPSVKYGAFIWCGPSNTAYAYLSNSAYSPGCYNSTTSGKFTKGSNCTSGTITYKSTTNYSYTSTTGASGVF